MIPWWDMPISRDLNLSDDQQKHIREITREYRTKLIDLRAGVEKIEGELEDLFDDENYDVNRAVALSERLATARGDLSRAFAVMNARLRGVLTVQQWRELQKRMPGPGVPGRGPRIRVEPGAGPKHDGPGPEGA